MADKRLELLTLLSPGPAHAAQVGLLATDLGVSRTDVKRLVGQLQAVGFGVVCNDDRVWVDRAGWPHARHAAEQYLERHPD